MPGDWELWNDGPGEVVARGTEEQVKQRYMDELDKGAIPEMNLYIEGPDERQYAYNRNMVPPQWDEILRKEKKWNRES